MSPAQPGTGPTAQASTQSTAPTPADPLLVPLDGQPVRVWDPLVRIFHWSLVVCVTLNLFVLDEGGTRHQWSGYAACGLVAVRLAWGFVGPRHARWGDFFPTPARLARHLGALLRGQHPPYRGHNPVGAVMMLGLMVLVLALGLSGWLMGTDAFFGSEEMEEFHEVLANTLMLAVGLHAAAALVMGRLERVGLVRAMITGVKKRY